MTPSYRQTVEARRWVLVVADEMIAIQRTVDFCIGLGFEFKRRSELDILAELMGELLTHKEELEALEVGV